MVIEATYNPRGLIISESRVFCSCANPLGRIFEIAEILASYIQFLRNKKTQLHFVAVLFLLCKLRTGRLVCIAKTGGVGKVPLSLSKCMLVSAVAYMRLTPFMRISANCRDLYAPNRCYWGITTFWPIIRREGRKSGLARMRASTVVLYFMAIFAKVSPL